MSIKEPVGSFGRGGETRDAYTAGEATALRNAGWHPLVGEQGPELVNLPEGARVRSSEETAAAMRDVAGMVEPADGQPIPPDADTKEAK